VARLTWLRSLFLSYSRTARQFATLKSRTHTPPKSIVSLGLSTDCSLDATQTSQIPHTSPSQHMHTNTRRKTNRPLQTTRDNAATRQPCNAQHDPLHPPSANRHRPTRTASLYFLQASLLCALVHGESTARRRSLWQRCCPMRPLAGAPVRRLSCTRRSTSRPRGARWT